MTDSRPAYDEQLPWLEAVDDEDEPRGVSAGKMLAALLVVLLAAALVAGAFFWLGRRDAGGGPPELIRAEPGPYKIPSKDPGNLDVAGESETAFQTSAGEDTDAQLDLSKLPAQPAPAPAVEPAPKRIPPNETKEPIPAETPVEATPSGPPGSVIQLGAYANRAQAERAWTVFASRFPTIGALDKMIVPFSGGIRLRAATASPDAARAACAAVRAGGENCFVAR